MAHGAILGQMPTIDTSTLVTQDSLTNTLSNYATTASLNNYLLKSGGAMTGQLNMGRNKITNLADGTVSTDAATVGQLNAAVATQVAAIFGNNDEHSGIVIAPTCLYVWMDDTLRFIIKAFGSQYATINKWYNLSGLYNKGITQLDLLAPSGTNTNVIGDVTIEQSNFSVSINTIYCGFAYFQTSDYN